MENLRRQYNDNVQKFKADFADCSDFLLKEAETGGRKCFFAVMDGLVDSLQLGQMIMGPVLGAQVEACTPGEQFRQLMRTCVQSVELKEAKTFEDAYYYLMSGFCVFVLDGCPRAMVMGIQGWTKRNTDEPESESNVRGAKECFVESVNDNKALLRKRMKTNHLKLRQIQLGTAAPTPVVLAFLDDRAAPELVNAVEQRLKDAHLNTVADYGELVPFLDTNMRSFFSAVGTTERPDVLASKLYEGRVAVLVEGTPFVLYVPYLFSDNFQSLDDYDYPPFFGGFVRLLKYFSFGISVFLPGVYVALGTFHQELIPTNLLFTIASAEFRTPLSLMNEAIMTLIFYEIMREAGLRLPKVVGHAVSIIGAIVIGEATVSAGLIGAPILVIIAITAIASYVAFPLYDSVSVLRLLFILAGGLTGLYGLMLGMAALFVNICSLSPYGVPYAAPIAPLNVRSLGDVFYRESWTKLARRRVRVQDLRGAHIDQCE